MSDRPNPRRDGRRTRRQKRARVDLPPLPDVSNRQRFPPRTTAIATGRVTRERSCDGKKRIRTPEHAAALAAHIEKTYGHKQTYYSCVFCGCYHLATEQG